MTDAIDSEHLQQLIDKVNEENSRLAQGSKEDKEKARQRQKAVDNLQKHQEKLKEYEDKLDTMGFRNSYSKTDPDATFMRMKEDAMNNGQTKMDKQYKRFRHRGFPKTQMDFGILAMAFNL